MPRTRSGRTTSNPEENLELDARRKERQKMHSIKRDKRFCIKKLTTITGDFKEYSEKRQRRRLKNTLQRKRIERRNYTQKKE